MNKLKQRTEVSHRAVFRYHERWGYAYRSNLNIRQVSPDPTLPTFSFRTNGDGFRAAHERDAFAQSPKTKILFIGCSFAAAHGVANEQSFTQLIEDKLENVIVYNAALPGAGFDQEYLILQDIIAGLKPDFVVFAPYSRAGLRHLHASRAFFNPFFGRMSRRQKPYYELHDGALQLKNVPVSKWIQNSDDKVPGMRFIDIAQRRIKTDLSLYIQRFDQPTKIYRKHTKEYALTRRIMEDAARLAQDHGARMIFMPLPSGKEFKYTSFPLYRAFFKDVADSTASGFIDVFDTVKAYDKKNPGRAFLRNDGHYSPGGHELVARAFLASFKGIA